MEVLAIKGSGLSYGVSATVSPISQQRDGFVFISWCRHHSYNEELHCYTLAECSALVPYELARDGKLVLRRATLHKVMDSRVSAQGNVDVLFQCEGAEACARRLRDDAAVSLEDTAEELTRKILKAGCLAKLIKGYRVAGGITLD